MENQVEFSKTWESLGIANDFLFGKIMQDAELCKELLQRILPDLEIDHIEYPELQKGIRADADAKSVRLDVYVKDGRGSVYDIDYSDFRVIPINHVYSIFWGCLHRFIGIIFNTPVLVSL